MRARRGSGAAQWLEIDGCRETPGALDWVPGIFIVPKRFVSTRVLIEGVERLIYELRNRIELLLKLDKSITLGVIGVFMPCRDLLVHGVRKLEIRSAIGLELEGGG